MREQLLYTHWIWQLLWHNGYATTFPTIVFHRQRPFCLFCSIFPHPVMPFQTQCSKVSVCTALYQIGVSYYTLLDTGREQAIFFFTSWYRNSMILILFLRPNLVATSWNRSTNSCKYFAPCATRALSFAKNISLISTCVFFVFVLKWVPLKRSASGRV